MNTLISTIILTAGILAQPSRPILPGSEDWDSGFDGNRAWQHVAVLTSDSLAGRYSGFIGTDKADAYIAQHFESLGLDKPFGRDGYFHEFTYGAGEYALPGSFVARYPDGEVDSAFMWEEYNIYKYSGFGKVRGPLVFAGYGISAPDKGWDEFEGLDLEGAIVLAMRGTPDLPGVEWGREGASGFKSTSALERGAVGFIMTQGDPPKLATISEKYYREELPAVWISQTLADSLLKSTGKTKADWQKQIKEQKKSVSREVEVEIEFQVSGEYYPERQTRNIAGLLPGTDPDLKAEIVLIGAHMDHHGTDAAGNIYPGADDNASGTSAMMELARVFATGKGAHRRSLMFMGFACEEEGLVGSKAFVESLPLEGYEIVAMLNMDMVGQGNCSLGVAGIGDFPLLGEIMFESWPDSSLDALEFWGLHGSSDQASFMDVGIRSYIIGARGKHPNYHTPYDTAGAIKPEVLKGVGDMVYHCASAIADYPDPLIIENRKAKYLLIRYPGIIREVIALEGLSEGLFTAGPGELDTSSSNLMNRVPLQIPTAIYEMSGYTPRWDPDMFLRGTEAIREYAKSRAWEMMVDSTSTDSKADAYKGMSLLMYFSDLPDDQYSLKALTRLGVGFTSSRYTNVKEVGSDMDGKRKIELSNDAGIIPIIEVSRIRIQEIGDFQDLVKPWGDNVILTLPTFRPQKLRELPEYAELADSGHFLLFEFHNHPNWRKKINWEEITEALMDLSNSEYAGQIGIEPDEEMVQRLLDAGMSDEMIGDLLNRNFRRTLAKWSADPEYTSVD